MKLTQYISIEVLAESYTGMRSMTRLLDSVLFVPLWFE